ncbi:MAG: ABC transporter permease [Actinomycetota bacterium]|jgi:peptide/nickel transport system permease protein|nr:ABC transporter permease [Actinomycetota bacterium]
MGGYILRRVGQSVIVLIGVVLVVFILTHLLPGGPRALLNPQASPQVVRQFYRENGYTKPLIIQFFTYLSNVARGNLGFSYSNNATVTSLLATALPRTTILVGLAYLVGLVVAVPLGAIQAIRRNRIIDHILSTAALVSYSMPQFWLGMLFILYLAIRLRLLPAEGPQGGLLSNPLSLVLPVCTLAAGTFAVFARFVRSSAIDALVRDYVRTARGKGMSEKRVFLRHVLRNAILPIITLIGLSLPGVISGAVVVESLFNYPGMGLLFWKAAVTHDYPLLLGFTLVVGVATVTGSLLADILYGVADPRMRVGGSA